MEISKMRAIISLLVIGAFVLTGTVLALYPMLADLSPNDGWTTHFERIAAFYSGVVGAIVGYYFGRSD
jgi:hypothetical protein